MRVTKEKAAENRERILTEAARLFRERGVSAVGMDALADAAGLTHGSLYSQFDSKEHLAAEALGRAFDASAAKYGEIETLSAYVERYLSPRHRDTPGSGCAIATLGCEVPRQGDAMRHEEQFLFEIGVADDDEARSGFCSNAKQRRKDPPNSCDIFANRGFQSQLTVHAVILVPVIGR